MKLLPCVLVMALSTGAASSLADQPSPKIPGGDTAGAEANPRLIDAIRNWSKQADLTASVCTGAEFPSIDVKRDVRFVDSGRVMTSAGISAGIDMALAIVERYYGGEAAKYTARVMQHESRPSAP